MTDSTAVRVLGAELNRTNLEHQTDDHSRRVVTLPSGVEATTVVFTGRYRGTKTIATGSPYSQHTVSDTEPVFLYSHDQDEAVTDVQDITPPAYVAVKGTITRRSGDDSRPIIHPNRIAELTASQHNRLQLSVVEATLDRLKTNAVDTDIAAQLREAAIDICQSISDDEATHEQTDAHEAVPEMSGATATQAPAGIDAIADAATVSLDELPPVAGLGETAGGVERNCEDSHDQETVATTRPAAPPGAACSVIDDIDPATVDALAAAGIETVGQLRDASLEAITSAHGVSEPTAESLRRAATGLIHNYLTHSLLDKHDEATLRQLAQSAGIDPAASLTSIADGFVRAYARPGRTFPPQW